MVNRATSPSTTGVPPRMQKMFDGRQATRPIPVIVDESDRRAILAAAADQRPKTEAVQWDTTGPRVGGAEAVFGQKVTGAPGNAAQGGTFNPVTGTENFE